MNESMKFLLDELAVARLGCPDLIASLVAITDLACVNDCGGAVAARKLLLGLYDPRQHLFELTELQRLDGPMFEHAMNCIRLRVEHRIEPHELFAQGSEIFEGLRNTENECGE